MSFRSDQCICVLQRTFFLCQGHEVVWTRSGAEGCKWRKLKKKEWKSPDPVLQRAFMYTHAKILMVTKTPPIQESRLNDSVSEWVNYHKFQTSKPIRTTQSSWPLSAAVDGPAVLYLSESPGNTCGSPSAISAASKYFQTHLEYALERTLQRHLSYPVDRYKYPSWAIKGEAHLWGWSEKSQVSHWAQKKVLHVPAVQGHFMYWRLMFCAFRGTNPLVV